MLEDKIKNDVKVNTKNNFLMFICHFCLIADERLKIFSRQENNGCLIYVQFSIKLLFSLKR